MDAAADSPKDLSTTDGTADLGAEAGPVCGFAIANPDASGLPNPAMYTTGDGGVVLDDVEGLVWEATVNASTFTQADGAAYCAGKGAGWRLPTRLELLSLVDFTIAPPGPTINAAFANTPGDFFWTSSSYVEDDGTAWSVNFNSGRMNFLDVTTKSWVRCVRAPAPDCAPARDESQDGGLVRDLLTSLTWQQTLDPSTYDWADAKTYCAGLGAGWRLPGIAELETLVDDTKTDPAIDLGAFPGTTSGSYWTSSPYAGGAGIAWTVDFFDGNNDVYDVTLKNRLRCVR